MFTDILWRFLVLATFVMGALCCMCAYEHPQKYFCVSEFVLRVRIEKEIKVNGTKAFWVSIQKVFKGDDQKLRVRGRQFVILEMDPWCPVDPLKTGYEYVIFGDNKKGSIYTMDCYGSMPWRKTTLDYRVALDKHYKENCDCVPKPNDITRQGRCKWNYSFMRKSDKYCKWVKTRNFRICKRKMLIWTLWR